MDIKLRAITHHDVHKAEMLISSNDFFKLLAVTLGFFFTSLRIMCHAIGVILARCP